MGEEYRPLVPVSVPAEGVIPTGALIASGGGSSAVVWLDPEDWRGMRGFCGSRQVLTIPETDSRVLVLKIKHKYTFFLKTDWCSRGLLPLPGNGSFINTHIISSHPISGFISPEESEELLNYTTSQIAPIAKKVNFSIGTQLVFGFHANTSLFNCTCNWTYLSVLTCP